MKRFLVLIVNFLMGMSAYAEAKQVLIGAMVGDPTGISAKYEVDQNISIDGGLSYSLGARSGAQLHGDYLLTNRGVVVAGDSDLDLFYGIGLRMITLNSGDDKGKLSFGPRVPVGLTHELKDKQIEFFGEIAAILDLTPSTAADIDLSVGARFRF